MFFGSEGKVGVVAYDFADYLWLLAAGVGPMEAVEYGADEDKASVDFTAFAEKHAGAARKTGVAVLNRAKEAFPSFVADVEALCR